AFDFDGDDLNDEADRCPDVAGLASHQGCPAPASTATRDQDGDGIDDEADRCPTRAEDVDGFLDEDGCPDADQDLDLIPDARDGAPWRPEDWDGVEDEDGVPEATAPPRRAPSPIKLSGRWRRAEGPDAPLLLGETLHPAQPIRFAPGTATLDDAAARRISGVAAFLKLNPEITWVEVGVHTDALDKPRGAHLSSLRAHAIRRRLIAEGIAPGRLKAQGYGARVPLAGSATAAERAKNRRVELRILRGAPRGAGRAPLDPLKLSPPREDWLPPDAVVLRPPRPIRFDGAALRADAAPQLEAIAAQLKAHPEYPCVEIGAHTDGRGDLAARLRLSQARAEAVRAALIALGVAPRRLLVKGYGAARRRSEDHTARQRSRNDRVEFWVRPKRFIREEAP
ncbi:OmpA family protein, partial [Myxococcota bacterium]|nr:OmpA family protein [Myxococcota bacterium]